MATKKVKSTGRFGVRYGRRIRVRSLEVEKTLKIRHECPSCTKKALKRISAGIWGCRTCGLKVAGGAYSPEFAKKRPVIVAAKETKPETKVAGKAEE